MSCYEPTAKKLQGGSDLNLTGEGRKGLGKERILPKIRLAGKNHLEKFREDRNVRQKKG